MNACCILSDLHKTALNRCNSSLFMNANAQTTAETSVISLPGVQAVTDVKPETINGSVYGDESCTVRCLRGSCNLMNMAVLSMKSDRLEGKLVILSS